jgi:hypothetical protein
MSRVPGFGCWFPTHRRFEGYGCGAAGTRTPDLLLAKQPLYHLSYSP